MTGTVISRNLYAVHTPDPNGAPMNETALCWDCIGDTDLLYPEAEGADDRPEVIEWTTVEHPENNDTVCVSCGYAGAVQRCRSCAVELVHDPQHPGSEDGDWFVHPGGAVESRIGHTSATFIPFTERQPS